MARGGWKGGPKFEKYDDHGTVTVYRRYHLKKAYGITLEQYDFLYKQQNGLCYLCNEPSGVGKHRLSVDHDHSADTVRGLLCKKCNWAVGQLGDNEEGLLKALEYIKRKPLNEHEDF